MRRRKSVIGLVVTLAATAIATLIYNIDLRHSQRADNSAHNEAEYVQENLPTNATADNSAADVELRPSLADDRESTATVPLLDTVDAPRRSVADEEAIAKWVREDAMSEVPKRYSLIIERLALSASEIDALLEVLIEDWIANTRTRYSSGEGMDEKERAAWIAAIIGDTKLRQFLAFERNIGQHAEVLYM